LGIGLLSIGLATLDILTRPVDALPPQNTTAILERIVLLLTGNAAGAALVAARLGVASRLASSDAAAAGRLVGPNSTLPGRTPPGCARPRARRR
jgi:hypothetical protein